MLRAATLLTLIALCAAGPAYAAPIFSTGSGSAVFTVDRSATFDSLTSDGINLAAYTEGLLQISVPDTTFVNFNPFLNGTTTGFHYGSGGNNDFVTIRGTDDAVLTAVEFQYGSGFTLTDPTRVFLWQTLLNGVVTGGAAQLVTRPVVVGIRDAVQGFDELRVADFLASSQPGFGGLQAIALDNVVVELPRPIDPVAPEPTSLALMTLGGLGLLGGWRRAAARRSS